MFWEIATVYSMNRMKAINTVFGQNAVTDC